ncbi:Fasciclin domain-containing protein [Parapedobacter composti]|uniref:Fasciclin domain-containing protein n=1 Tax=Parapedobacter composti TaxID=623281 RepID=A0A1I1E117_9SPHI|nr:fasciclin domain-containing protein [Parapedobacter composti]SFB80871.1 Fasciclin domain-containing protein [Parapedobacter composti]
MTRRYTALGFAVLWCTAVLFNACKDKAWDEMYGRPDWLADPIYQQLESRGNFTSFLKVVEKAGYTNTLGKAGYWTLFAPNDEAFRLFLAENQLASVDDIDDVTATAIVKYALAYNAYRSDQLHQYQQPGGAIDRLAYKRKTAYYDFVKPGPSLRYPRIINNNTNLGFYNVGDNNYKHIPFFLKSFMDAQQLTAEDYNAFYPDRPYTGFNVAGAGVVTPDILAENGVIHEVDRVILPLPSIEDYLAANPKYSYFKQLLDELLVRYEGNADITHRFRVLTGQPDSVYTKIYSPDLAFSLNNENHINNTTAGQMEGYALVAPENEALHAYVHGPEGILMHYGSFDRAPTSILVDLINAHMWGQNLWPSKFHTVYNAHQELASFDRSHLVERKLASNGFFYGTNKVQEANVFRTVYSKIYLDPKYLLMNRAVGTAGIRFSMTNPLLNYSVFMMSDTQIRGAGYDFNTNTDAWTYTVNDVVQSGIVPQNRILRILQTAVVQQNITDLSGEGVLQTFNEEYIKYRNNQVFAAGNEDHGTVVTIDSVKTTVNGTVYYTKGILQFTENEIGFHIEKLAAQYPQTYGHFFNFLLNSPSRYNATTKQLNGTSAGVMYTVLAPSNAAIEDAVRRGDLPGDPATGVPNFTPPVGPNADKVSRFLQYHILDGRTVALDNRSDDPMAVATLYKTDLGDPTYITVTKSVGQLSFRDEQGNVTQADAAFSNNLSNRTLIHSINHVLNYRN